MTGLNRLARAASLLVRWAGEGRCGEGDGGLEVMVAAVVVSKLVGKAWSFCWMLVGVTWRVPRLQWRNRLWLSGEGLWAEYWGKIPL